MGYCCTYHFDAFTAGSFSHSTRGLVITSSIAGSGVAPAEGVGSPGAVPATAMVTASTEVVDGSVPAASATPTAGTSSPVDLSLFSRFNSEAEEEELQLTSQRFNTHNSIIP
jgi:hypothetical protein